MNIIWATLIEILNKTTPSTPSLLGEKQSFFFHWHVSEPRAGENTLGIWKSLTTELSAHRDYMNMRWLIILIKVSTTATICVGLTVCFKDTMIIVCRILNDLSTYLWTAAMTCTWFDTCQSATKCWAASWAASNNLFSDNPPTSHHHHHIFSSAVSRHDKLCVKHLKHGSRVTHVSR